MKRKIRVSKPLPPDAALPRTRPLKRKGNAIMGRGKKRPPPEPEMEIESNIIDRSVKAAKRLRAKRSKR